MFENLLVCWYCGKIGEEAQHCITCDKDSSQCQCGEQAVYWEHYRCPDCGSTW